MSVLLKLFIHRHLTSSNTRSNTADGIFTQWVLEIPVIKLLVVLLQGKVEVSYEQFTRELLIHPHTIARTPPSLSHTPTHTCTHPHTHMHTLTHTCTHSCKHTHTPHRLSEQTHTYCLVSTVFVHIFLFTYTFEKSVSSCVCKRQTDKHPDRRKANGQSDKRTSGQADRHPDSGVGGHRRQAGCRLRVVSSHICSPHTS